MEEFAEMYFGFSGAAEVLIGYHYFNRLSGKKSLTKLAASALVIVTVRTFHIIIIEIFK